MTPNPTLFPNADERTVDRSEFAVDIDEWPLVTLTTTGKPSVDALTAHLREIEELVLERRQDFVQIVDLRHAAVLDASQRAMIAEHQDAMEPIYGRHCRGEAYVGDQRVRGMMIAVFWQAKPSYPYDFFDHLDSARSWAFDRLAELRRQLV